MKNLLKIFVLAGAVATVTTSAAFAEHPASPQQKRLERVGEYWNSTSANSTRASSQQSDTSDAASLSGVSQYPCAHCGYDSRFGGYMKKPASKK